MKQDPDRKKKMVAPIIVTAIILFYYILYFALIISFVNTLFFKIMLGAIPIFLGAAMIYVCVQRIREIKGGEEDDLSKY